MATPLDWAELKARYDRDGYLVIENFVSPPSLEGLQVRMEELIGKIPESDLTHLFSSRDQKKHSNDYFLTSGDKVRFFLEEKAVDGGKIITEKRLSINKVGHALYEHDTVFRKFTGTEPILHIAKKVLGLKEPLVAQSMYICKQPFIGGAVAPHQDGSFLFTKPESVCAYWFPIDDATLLNACLWVVPGSHKEELRTRFKLTKERNSIYFEPSLDSVKWPDNNAYIPVEVKKGSVVLIHGHLAHKKF